MYPIEDSFALIKIIHMFVSVTFLVMAIWLFVRSYRGYFKGKPYTRLDKILSFGYLISLYLQLILGFILFSNLGSSLGYNYLGDAHSMKMVSKRLWPVEHIVMMLFALFIANLGLIISINTKSDKNKYKNTIIYYSISLLLILISLSVIYLF
ncbi:MAG: hypothetical protein WCH34_17830 [Bacteroidota bacterium]